MSMLVTLTNLLCLCGETRGRGGSMGTTERILKAERDPSLGAPPFLPVSSIATTPLSLPPFLTVVASVFSYAGLFLSTRPGSS